MEREVHVYLDLRGGPAPVGRLWVRSHHGRQSATFVYDARWLRHPARFALEPALPLDPAPLDLPRSGGRLTAFAGVVMGERRESVGKAPGTGPPGFGGQLPASRFGTRSSVLRAQLPTGCTTPSGAGFIGMWPGNPAIRSSHARIRGNPARSNPPSSARWV